MKTLMCLSWALFLLAVLDAAVKAALLMFFVAVAFTLLAFAVPLLEILGAWWLVKRFFRR